MNARTVPIRVDDPVNAAILAVSEDRIQGFQQDPSGEIASRSGVPVDEVLDRVRTMLDAGVVRAFCLDVELDPDAMREE